MPSQSLSLIQAQHLQMVLAPQLRQSLEMLQLPILELRAMIQKEIEQNPTIEETPTDKETVEIEPTTKEKESQEELDFDKEFEALAKLDEEWRDYFFQNVRVKITRTVKISSRPTSIRKDKSHLAASGRWA